MLPDPASLMGVTYAISPSRWEAPRALACCRCVPTAAVLSVLQAGAAGVAGKVRREPFDRTSCLVAPSGQISPLAKRPSCSTQPGDVGFVFSACRLHFKCANVRSLTSATFYLASFEPPHYELLLLLSFLSPRQEKCRSATTVCDSDDTSPRRAFCVCSEGEMPCFFLFLLVTSPMPWRFIENTLQAALASDYPPAAAHRVGGRARWALRKRRLSYYPDGFHPNGLEMGKSPPLPRCVFGSVKIRSSGCVTYVS